jgi:diketogulonate reductase-like aldo/keto reductase
MKQVWARHRRQRPAARRGGDHQQAARQRHGYDSTLRAFDATVAALGTDYLDLYLIHWPLPMRDLYVDTWRAFVRLREEGRIRSIGVSNFQPAHIERLQAERACCRPSIRSSCTRTSRRRRCATGMRGRASSSVVESAGAERLQDPTVARLAGKHGRSAAQILLLARAAWLVAIPKSQDPVRMRQNLAIFDFALDTQDRQRWRCWTASTGRAAIPTPTSSCSPGRMSLCDFATGAGLTRRLAARTMVARPVIASPADKRPALIENANGKICFFNCILISSMISFVLSQCSDKNIIKLRY